MFTDISIGGNDIGFSDIVKACVIDILDCNIDNTIRNDLNNKLSSLRSLYANLPDGSVIDTSASCPTQSTPPPPYK
jgi:hypothetical protein